MDWGVWRLIVGKIATLHEVEEHYSVTDILDGNEALDLQMRADHEASKRAKE